MKRPEQNPTLTFRNARPADVAALRELYSASKGIHPGREEDLLHRIELQSKGKHVLVAEADGKVVGAFTAFTAGELPSIERVHELEHDGKLFELHDPSGGKRILAGLVASSAREDRLIKQAVVTGLINEQLRLAKKEGFKQIYFVGEEALRDAFFQKRIGARVEADAIAWTKSTGETVPVYWFSRGTATPVLAEGPNGRRK